MPTETKTNKIEDAAENVAAAMLAGVLVWSAFTIVIWLLYSMFCFNVGYPAPSLQEMFVGQIKFILGLRIL